MLIKYKAIEEETYEDYIGRLYSFEQKKHLIHTITFQVTEDCCLQCTYCYQHFKTKNKMSFETAALFIDELLNDKYEYLNRKTAKGIIFEFIGGEPFLEIQLIEKIVNYLYKQMIEMEHPWLYYSVINMCSNGILYNTLEVQQYFQKYGMLTHLSISIDGSKELHDTCRIDLNNNGSYDRAINAVKQYRFQFNREIPTKMTLAPSNIQYLSEAIFNLINENYTQIRLNCIYEPGWTIHHAQILYNELKKVADYLIEHNLYNKIFISLFNEDSFKPLPENNTTNWCGGTADGGNLALNYTGKLYPCIRYMNSSLNNKREELYIGHIKTGICTTDIEKNNYQKINNITRQSQSPKECLDCPVADGCSWCSAYNYEETGSVNKRVTHICIMHKANSLANAYYWNKLYKTLTLSKKFIINLPNNEILNILGQNNYNELFNIIKGE